MGARGASPWCHRFGDPSVPAGAAPLRRARRSPDRVEAYRPQLQGPFHGGVQILDVAGSGGTSWSRVEHHRRGAGADDDIGMTFQDWGIPTPRALADLAPLRDHATLIASGGIRSGIDMVKALALGASLCGLASPFLQPATVSHEAVIAAIERLRKEFRTAMFLTGVGSVDGLVGKLSLIANAEPGV